MSLLARYLFQRHARLLMLTLSLGLGQQALCLGLRSRKGDEVTECSAYDETCYSDNYRY